MTMKLERIGREVIKPASPTTPSHVRTIHLSLFDQFLPTTYLPAIFFYDKTAEEETVSKILKSSLSETLTRFYPLAGRIQGVSLDCNDEGALFTQTRVDMLLSDLLTNPDALLPEQLIPSDSMDPGTWPLLNINVSFFKAGGMAIGVSVSHKICDTYSLMMFVQGWASAAKGCSDTVNPVFTTQFFYPPADLSVEFPSLVKHGTEPVTQRFVFSTTKLKELKSRAASENVMVPTRVEAATSLLLNSATKASKSNLPLVMTQTMDLRPRVPPALLPGMAIGNLFFLPFLKVGSEREMKIEETVTKLRKSKDDLAEIFKENPQENRTIAELVTSWCRFPLYEVDFGWGNPVWVAAGRMVGVQVIIMDAKDGEGIEAWVTLPEQDMLEFEHDQELLAYVTPNPSALI
ncbi:PREDICTED: BAHD acyltransferase At5g47980 [Tarenaya hassleriana]|uniref:BAHD acyltransferase At5g47980 n=1 Tax=Tarenaya hassleriana TaxID=28532 RepID=UPI00053C602A|nr:PREDICTED: BAHD acyltransferase At5g47980 [Tarenaya hassleriana]